MNKHIEQIFFLLKSPGFIHFVRQFGYIGILIWLISFDQFTPFPEEVSLLIIGYLSAHHIFHPILAGIFCLAGFLLVDTAYFFLSKRGSSFIKRWTKGSSSVMESYKQKLKTNMPKTLIALCFIPRMRMFAPILAGSSAMSFRKFLFYDALALTGFTAMYLSMGLIFHKTISSVIQETKGLEHIIFFGAAIVIATLIVVFVVRRKKKERESNNSD